ncbi:MAG: exodeoxyribonuclease V subunit alpha [Actinobacteria bacterium]|nr:exodeoxyribonuclease V subunit alpha [Actinomycetota bacterium]
MTAGTAGRPATLVLRDEFTPHRAIWSAGLLGRFNAAGILSAADVHVAAALGRLGGESDPSVLLAVALTVRGTRGGSVVLDLATIAEEVVPDDPDAASVDEEQIGTEAVADLDWPEPEQWRAACAASPLVAGRDDPPGRPVRMVGRSLWLDRYFGQERDVATDLLARAAAAAPEVDEARLSAALARLFPAAGDADQRAAAEQAVRSRLTVIAGGPGTGKTTTVARLLALLCDQPGPPPRIALAAPTGKAAARLTEAVQAAVGHFAAQDRERVGDCAASTVHRLLGFRPGSRTRFRHDRTNRLPHDVVVIDETSMVSLTLMARLTEAVRPTSRLILVGDPDQLASVEAGAVLGDLTAEVAAGRNALAPCVARLTGSRRFAAQGRIAGLAAAVRDGAVEETLRILRSGEENVEFVEIPPGSVPDDGALGALRADVLAAGAAMSMAAAAGDASAALAAADSHRLLCAHRSGPFGVRLWGDRVIAWLAAAGHTPAARIDGRYLGEPILVTTNDAELELFNGDTGVIVAAPDGTGTVAAFRRGSRVRTVAPARLPAVRSVHAMTVHRAQGSEFERVTILLPPPESPLANRQTLYTAITRAGSAVRLIGSADAVARAVSHPAARATGLGPRLRVADPG